MDYIALYRKYRPKTFNEIIGQEHISRILQNQVINNKTAHAYMFIGGRGTGKTSSAKVFARALNCENPINGEPCNNCKNCKMELSGSMIDIIELDAASNNGVDYIRSIVEDSDMLPISGKYKVYIIDEAHMLSKSAFNTLLKTLEEPPAHVKFILATTDPQKIIPTIKSRCQQYQFKQIGTNDIQKAILEICNNEGISITQGSAKIIADLADGALRDALSLLERILQNGDETITEEIVTRIVGIPSKKNLYNLFKAIKNVDIANIELTINSILDEGNDIEYVVWEIIKYAKDILIYKSNKELITYSNDDLKEIEELEKDYSKERLVKIILELLDLQSTISKSNQKKIMLEATLFNLADFEITTSSTSQDIVEKISSLENLIKTNKDKTIVKEVRVEEAREVKKVEPKLNFRITDEITSTSKPIEPVQNTIENKNVVKFKNDDSNSWWKEELTKLKSNGKMTLYTSLMNSVIELEGESLVKISFPKGITSFGKTLIEIPDNKKYIKDVLTKHYNKDIGFKYVFNENKENDKPKKSGIDELEDLAKQNNIKFDIN